MYDPGYDDITLQAHGYVNGAEAELMQYRAEYGPDIYQTGFYKDFSIDSYPDPDTSGVADPEGFIPEVALFARENIDKMETGSKKIIYGRPLKPED